MKQTDQCTCHLRRSKCRVCPHAYYCLCLDATLHATVCKHVHLVHMTQRGRTIQLPDYAAQSMDFSSYFQSQPGPVHSITGLRATLLGKLNEPQVVISNCYQIDALQSSKQHITAAIIFRARQCHSYQQNEKCLLAATTQYSPILEYT